MIQIKNTYYFKDCKRALEDLQSLWAAIGKEEEDFISSSKRVSVLDIEIYSGNFLDSFNISFVNEHGEIYRNRYTVEWLEEHLVEYKKSEQEELDV